MNDSLYCRHNIYVWFRIGWSCCPLFCVLVCLLLQPSVSLPLSRGVVSEHSSTPCDQPQGPPSTYCRCRQPSCLLCRHLLSQVRAACGSSAQSQLTVEDAFWNTTILHTADMTQPSQSALSEQGVHSGKSSTRQDINVGYFVLP